MDRVGDLITGTGVTDIVRIDQAMVIKAASPTPTLATHHHHHQGGTGVAGEVPDSIGDVITGMIVIDTEGGKMEDTEGTENQ